MFTTVKKYLNRIFYPVFLPQIRLKAALESTITPLAVDGVRCLDVGCGDRPYEYLFTHGSYTGIDVMDSGRPINMKQSDHFYDGNVFPFQNDSFDMVISPQVLEHVPDPLVMLKEMARVCKPGGGVVISLPFVYQEHEEPFDYFRFTRFGIEELLGKAGLRVETMKRDSGALEVIAILANVYVAHILVLGIRGFGRLYALLFCFPIQLFAMIFRKFSPTKASFISILLFMPRKYS